MCEKEKESTARLVLFKEMGILNSYTLESTFFGSELFRFPQKRVTSLPANLPRETVIAITKAATLVESRDTMQVSGEDLI